MMDATTIMTIRVEFVCAPLMRDIAGKYIATEAAAVVAVADNRMGMLRDPAHARITL